MHIETLKTFCDLVELKSFSRASEANYVTQSAVSQQIRNLERTWKAVLLERSKRAIRLTPAGEIVYKQAKIILEHYRELQRLLGGTNKVVSGTIRVAAIHGVGLHELPPYIRQFIKRFPQVQVRLGYMRDSQVYDQVMKGLADLGIVAFPTPRPQLEVVPFRDDRLAVVCHPRHPLAKFKKISLSRLGGMSFVAFERGIPTRSVTDHLLKESGIAVRTAMEFDNIETLKKAIEIDAGVSILPRVTIRNEIERKTLKAVEIAGKPLIRPLGILLQKGRVLPAPVGKFVEILLSKDIE